MSIEQVKQVVRHWCDAFERQEKSGSSSESSRVAVQRLKELGATLDQSSDPLQSLAELEDQVAVLSQELSDDQSSVSKTQAQAQAVQRELDKTLINQFITMPGPKKAAKLKDPQFARILKAALARADQKAPQSSRSGNTIAHVLTLSRSPEVRALAQICLDHGADPNQENARGETIMHQLVTHEDVPLLQACIRCGGDPTRTPVNARFSPILMAIGSGRALVAMEMCIAGNVTTVNGTRSVDYFLPEVDRYKSERAVQACLKLATVCYAAEGMGARNEKLWKICASKSSPGLQWSPPPALLDLARGALDEAKPLEQCESDRFSSLCCMASGVLRRNCSQPTDWAFIEKLLDSEELALLTFQGRHSCLQELHDRVQRGEIKLSASQMSKLNEQLKKYPDVDNGQTIWLFFRMSDSRSLSSLLEIYKEAVRQIQLLKGRNAPEAAYLEKQLHRFALQQPGLTEYNAAQRDLATTSKVINVRKSRVYDFMVQELIARKDYKALGRVVSTRTDAEQVFDSRFTFHVLLDKSGIAQADEYDGNWNMLAAHALENAMNNVVKGEGLPKSAEKEVKSFCTQYSDMLKEYVELSQLQELQLGEAIPPLTYGRTITSRLKKLPVGGSILVPCGCNGHATSLLITKTTAGTYQVTHLNTGSGVQHHHTMKGKFQTADTYTEVPAASIENTENWGKVFACRRKKGMDLVYETLKKTIQSGGEREEASDYEEDYEPDQQTGSCVTQNLMAGFRHMVLAKAQGSRSERLATYKLAKAGVQGQVAKSHVPQSDSRVQACVQPQLKRLNGEMTLANLADTQESYDQAMADICGELKIAGMDMAAEMFKAQPGETFHQRFSHLREASLVLTQAWMEDESVQFPEPKSPALAFAAAKFNKRMDQVKNLCESCEVALRKQNRRELASVWTQLLGSSKLGPRGALEIYKLYGDQPPPYTFLMEVIKTVQPRAKERASPSVELMARKAEAEGKTEQADAIRKQWSILESRYGG